MTIQEFARNFTRSSTTARRGTRSPTICRNIVELGGRMRGLSQNAELFHESDAIASGSKFAGLRLEIPRLLSE
jgi:hypothetical protein